MTLQVQAPSFHAGSLSLTRAVAFAFTAVVLLAGCSGISAPTPLIAESMPSATSTPSPAPISLLTPEPERWWVKGVHVLVLALVACVVVFNGFRRGYTLALSGYML